METQDVDVEATFPWDGHMRGWVIKETEDWYVAVVPMLFNHRIVFGPQVTRTTEYERGWCYPSAVPAVIAALAWEPDTQDEPVGFVKRAGEQL